MNRTIRCLIVDDEPLAREGLARYISRLDGFELAGECEDALQLDNRLKSDGNIDLIFLDIEMPLISGLDYLQNLSNPPLVIVTTAYERYALKGYELDVLDYLLKPIPFPRFLKAAEKAREHLNLRQVAPGRGFILVRADKKLHKIDIADISYIEAVENYVKLVTSDGVTITRTTLRDILAELPSDRFLQVHKSYIVNMDKVSYIEGNMLTLPGAVVQVSRSYKDILGAWIERMTQ